MKELKVRAVRHYPDPKYPSKEEARLDPSLLRAVPRRWAGKGAVCAALSATLALGLSSCADARQGAGGNDISAAAGKETAATAVVSGRTEYSFDPFEPERDKDGKLKLSVPVFEHGLGRGSYGCESVAPPVFLSEEEALQVIREEAAARGVQFGSGTSHPVSAELPVTQLAPSFGSEDDNKKQKTKKGTLTPDGWDETLGIGFEFVSKKDVSEWRDENGLMASVESYDMKGAAVTLAENNRNIAVFYDPGEDWSRYGELNWSDWEENEKKAAQMREDNIALLREQVREFLAWLAAQGII